jgi:hypothetical protein
VRRILLIAGLLTLASLAASQDAAKADGCGGEPTLIIPGKCVGPIAANTPYAKLRAALAGHEIRPGITVDEEGYKCGTFVDPDGPGQLYIVWDDPKDPDWFTVDLAVARKHCLAKDYGTDTPDDILVPGAGQVLAKDGSLHEASGGSGSLWHTADGIRMGMPLHELRQKLKGAVTLWGWGWDYGGRAALSPQLWATMTYDDAAERRLTQAEMRSLTGEKQIDLRNEVLNRLDPVVGSFDVAMKAVPQE